MSTPKRSTSRNLGEILVLMRACDAADIARAAEEQRLRATDGEAKQLGAILLDHKCITLEQLERALAVQRETRRSPAAAAKAILDVARDQCAHLGLAAAGGAR